VVPHKKYLRDGEGHLMSLDESENAHTAPHDKSGEHIPHLLLSLSCLRKSSKD